MRDNRFHIELVHHNGSFMHEETSGQKINTKLRDTFFTVLHNVESKSGDNKINLNIALDNFKGTPAANEFHLNCSSVSSSNSQLETPEESNKFYRSDQFLYIKRGEHVGSFGCTKSAAQKLLTVNLVFSNGSSKTTKPQNKPISVIVEEGCVDFLEDVPSSGGQVDLRASYERQYGESLSFVEEADAALRKESTSLLSASTADSSAPSHHSVTQPTLDLEPQNTAATHSTSTESGKDSDGETSPRVSSFSRSYELKDRIVLLMKGKFAGYFGKILSSDEVRHKIYIVNSDKSVILNGAKVKKRQKRSHDYLKSTCWVLPEAPTAVSDLEELQHLLSPAKQENFRFLRSRMLSQSQVQSADVSAPSGLRREQGSSSSEWSLASSAYVIISGGPWFGHFGRIQRARSSGTDQRDLLLYIVNRNGEHVLNEHNRHYLTALVPWSQSIALPVPVPPTAVLDLDASLDRLGARASFLRNRRAAIEERIENHCWMQLGDCMHLLDNVLEDIIGEIEVRDSLVTTASERERAPESNQGDKDLDLLLFQEDIDLVANEQADTPCSEPRSARVYQPSPSQRQPPLSQSRGRMASSYQTRYDSEDSDDEARNNLYFVDGVSQQQSSSSGATFSGRFFCLCYTNRSKIDHGDVEVIPIGLPSDDADGSLNYCCPSVVVSVARSRLRPLDPPLVRKHFGRNVLAGEYLLALLCFADWDNFSVASFVWPSNIVALFMDDTATNDLCREAVAHPLSTSPYGQSCLSKVILFHLCANHLGIFDSFDKKSFFSRGESTQEIAHLLSQLSAIRVNSDENCVQRTASRVGADYQATLPVLQELQNQEEDGIHESSSRCYSYRECNAKKFEDKLMVQYLGSVQELRERFLSPGHLVEIPISVGETAAHVEKYSQEPIKGYAPKHFDSFALNNALVELRCLKKKSVTAFGFVKECRPAVITAHCDTDSDSLKSMEEGTWDNPMSVTAVVDEDDCSDDDEWSESISLLVKLENGNVKVPFKLCRSFLLPVDQALDILYATQFDLKLALKRVRKVLRALTTSADDTIDSWTADCFCAKEIDAFYLAFQRHRRNVRALWIAYNQLVTKIRRGKSKKPSRKGAEDIPEGGGGPRNMSFKRIFYLFTLFFIERDEVSTNPLPCPVTRKKRAESAVTVSGDGGAEKSKRNVLRDSTSTGARPPGWPPSLPMTTHNIYFLKGRNSPCICIDVDVSKEDSIVVQQICTGSYNHKQAVPISAVEPFQEDLLEQCYDDRTAPFTVALINFSAWELSSANSQVAIPADSHLRKWYIYPSFIIKMLSHLPLLKEWRVQAERAARNVKADRSVIYYNCLVQNYRNLKEHEINADGRLDQQGYPWEAAYREMLDCCDSEGTEEEEEDEHEEDEDADDEDGAGAGAGTREGSRSNQGNRVQQLLRHERNNETSSKRLRYDSKVPAISCEAEVSGDEGMSVLGVKRSHSEDAESCGTDHLTRPAQRARIKGASTGDNRSGLKPPLSISLNIFWLDRSNLPCLYYDTKDNVASEKILIQPICCSTYHYYVSVSRKLIEPLSPENLKGCSEERTIEFAGALTDFARWHLSSISQKLRAKRCSEDDTHDRDPEAADSVHRHYVDVDNKSSGTTVRYYIWPSRILNLVTQPKLFSAFRKEAERSKRSGGRRAQYLDALLKLYNDSDNGNSSDSDSGSDSEGE